jgi:hypothetical protein
VLAPRTVAAILMWLVACASNAGKHRSIGASDLAEIDRAALELLARASATSEIGNERWNACFATLASAEEFLLAPGSEVDSVRVHARATAALTEVVYFARTDEAVRLASLALDALDRDPRDVVAAAWAAQALRAADQADLRAEPKLEERLVRLASSVPLDAPTVQLSAAHGIRGLLARAAEDDPRMREVGAELLGREWDHERDLEAAWLASIGFFQHGGRDGEAWNKRLKSSFVDRAKPAKTPEPDRADGGFSSRDLALLVLVFNVAYRYSAIAGAR